ncbi:MAG: peptide chain release factor N(5)-glutamine methyltransferase [Bdellovibrionales bacterium]
MSTASRSLKQLLQEATLAFQAKGFESAKLDADLLMRFLKNLSETQLLTQNHLTLYEEELKTWEGLVQRRLTGEPIAYITQKKEFYKNSFFVNSQVLIPRPETELFMDIVLEWLKEQTFPKDRISILDLGCGSGCIGLSLLEEIPKSLLVGVDISRGAIEVSQANAQNLKLASRTFFVECDLSAVEAKHLQKIHDNKFRIIVSNPPYIANNDPAVEAHVHKFEPALALYAGPSGYEKIEAWLRSAGQVIHHPGICVFEIGMGQSQRVKEIFQSSKIFHKIRVMQDLAGFDRFVVGYN